ncbi:glutamate receptor-interacting protein 2-like isoform X2 [Branchiostoma floridae]|uniref:Glutamate receptor-interacting protein 2-like isoform X2 n=1 Tax=Branchiostoma floridae TaxID=7739 RepID=A0A9J7L8P9_BRAFL|nr:glutamate receptor-interacting protein 2-like isoform X2 [Branchiostoma floridae]
MPAWKPSCLKAIESEDGDYAKKPAFLTDDLPFGGELIPDERRGVSVVELTKRDGSGLGLTISGGLDKGSRARVLHLRPGGLAQRSDALEIGDYILSVNGIRTEKLRHDEIINLLKNAGEKVILEVEYEIPLTAQEAGGNVVTKEVELSLQKEGGSFGFTIRGGVADERRQSRPLLVTNIRPGGPADREGTLAVGDRLLAIDNISLSGVTHAEAVAALKQCGTQASLLVEYDVSIMEAVQNAKGPLLVEVTKAPGASLGITPGMAVVKNREALIIKEIKAASIADRCGALHAGDQLLSIDGTSTEHLTLPEAVQLLASTGAEVKLEILPLSHMKYAGSSNEAVISNGCRVEVQPTAASLQAQTREGSWRESAHHHSAASHHVYVNVSQIPRIVDTPPALPPKKRKPRTSTSKSGTTTTSSSSGSTLDMSFKQRSNSESMLSDALPISYPMDSPTSPSVSSIHTGTISRASLARRSNRRPPRRTRLNSSAMSVSSSHAPQQVVRVEIAEVQVHPDPSGLGFSLQGGVFATETLTSPPVIGFIDPDGPADRTGILQVGDRVLSINGMSTEELTLEEANQLLRESGLKCVLEVEFDVAESVVPSSGTFNIKLPKRAGGLGITINSPSTRKQGEPLLISDIKKGSVAHRTGTLAPGDKLLAIDNIRLDNCSMEDAAQILAQCDEIVKLRIRKDELYSEEHDVSGAICYSVELVRHGGPLGITISGTEEPFDPVTVSGLTDGGLAQRTGAIHIGDRILAINSQSLRGKRLSEAIQLLQSAGDTVTLKISRQEGRQISLDKFVVDGPKSDQENDSIGKEESQTKRVPLQHTPVPSVDSAVESWDGSALEPGNPEGNSQHPQSGMVVTAQVHHNDNQTNHMTERHTLRRDSTKADRRMGERLHDEWDAQSHSYKSSSDILDNPQLDEYGLALEDLETCGHSELMRQIEQTIGPGSNHAHTLNCRPRPNQSVISYSDSHSMTLPGSNRGQTPALPTNKKIQDQMSLIFSPTPIEIQKVTLFKDDDYGDFGFSVSDGLVEKGVYINNIRPGGPADLSGVIRPYDRILQVNNSRTRDFDCCLAVPLIAASGDKIELVISRNPLAQNMSQANLEWGEEAYQHPQLNHNTSKTL